MDWKVQKPIKNVANKLKISSNKQRKLDLLNSYLSTLFLRKRETTYPQVKTET